MTTPEEVDTMADTTESKKTANGGHGDNERDPNLPPAPDGGWGWVVVFGSFMVHVIADGIAYSFGIYVEDFVAHFGCSRGAVGTLGSLMLGVTWGSGKDFCLRIIKVELTAYCVLGEGLLHELTNQYP